MIERRTKQIFYTTVIKTLVQRFSYVALVLAALSLIILSKMDVILIERLRVQVTDAISPLLKVLSSPIIAVNHLVTRVEEVLYLHEENIRLRAENAHLLQWRSVAQVLEKENTALRELLNYIPTPTANVISARVIGDQGGSFVHSQIINAGKRDGVRKGQAVITNNGLVGRINMVGTRFARILLITDLNFRIPVIVGPDRVRAILAGNNEETLLLIRLPINATVSSGDRVFTSGHGSAFPPDLPVGVVVSTASGGVATVQPFIDRYRLAYVRVVDYGLKGIISTTRPNSDMEIP